MIDITTSRPVSPSPKLPAAPAASFVAVAELDIAAKKNSEHARSRELTLSSQRENMLSIGPVAEQAEQTGDVVADAEAARRAAEEAIDRAVDAGLGDNELIKDIIALMAQLQGSWLDRYAEVLGNYVKAFDQITKALNELQYAITGTDDEGNFIVDFSRVIAALRSIGQPVIGGNFSSHAEAQAFLKELGVDWFEISSAGPPYQLMLKRAVIDDLVNVFEGSWVYLTPTEYNSKITSKDTLLDRLMHMNRVLPDKNQRMLDLWNTLVKTLSGTIDSLNEARTRYVNNLI